MRWGSFGDIIFKTGFSPSPGISQKLNYTLPKHRVIFTYPLIDFTGEDIETLELPIVLNRAFIKPEEAVLKLKEFAEKGEDKPLVIGKLYLGRYVIEGIETMVEETLEDGTLWQVKFKVKLIKVKNQSYLSP